MYIYLRAFYVFVFPLMRSYFKNCDAKKKRKEKKEGEEAV